MESVRSCYCDLNVVAGGGTSNNEELLQTLANCEPNTDCLCVLMRVLVYDKVRDSLAGQTFAARGGGEKNVWSL